MADLPHEFNQASNGWVIGAIVAGTPTRREAVVNARSIEILIERFGYGREHGLPVCFGRCDGKIASHDAEPWFYGRDLPVCDAHSIRVRAVFYSDVGVPEARVQEKFSIVVCFRSQSFPIEHSKSPRVRFGRLTDSSEAKSIRYTAGFGYLPEWNSIYGDPHRSHLRYSST